MTNRSSILGAFCWVLLAGMLTSAALQPVSASPLPTAAVSSAKIA